MQNIHSNLGTHLKNHNFLMKTDDFKDNFYFKRIIYKFENRFSGLYSFIFLKTYLTYLFKKRFNIYISALTMKR